MANYDNKLGEWFKQVEQQEQALRAKKTVGGQDIHEEPKVTIEEAPVTPQIRTMEIEGPAKEAPASVVATVEAVGVVADTTLAVEDKPQMPIDEESAAKLFSDEEIPQVEDFFSFLNRAAEQPVVEEVEEHVFELPKEQPSLGLSEGTGDPRPLVSNPVPPAPIELPKIESRVEMPLPPKPVPAPKPIIEEPIIEQEAVVEPVVETPVVKEQPKPTDDESDAQANWDRVPRHLQTLFGSTSQEVAQNSYKAFKETREELIQRLLDPTVSLEEAARILNVCPTTVRRYTNRGVLQHYRTAGNQRRFKLSDVLAFMEKGQRGPATEKAEEAE